MKILKPLFITAVLLIGVACSSGSVQQFEVDSMRTADGKELSITFFGHASLAIDYDGHQIYIDPISDFADYAKLPKADVILITHEHGDHFDPKAIAAATGKNTVIVANPVVGEQVTGSLVMRNGDELTPVPYLGLQAVPAYNITEGRTQFHPQGRDNGYVLTLGGTRIYIAGDTEDIPEMGGLGEIDIAFLPVNQPYTMTPEQAADAARTIAPKILYPYHLGMGETVSDVESLYTLLDGTGIEVRIRRMQ